MRVEPHGGLLTPKPGSLHDIPIPALFAEKSSPPTVRRVNTALRFATPMPGRRWHSMTDDLRSRVQAFRTAMSVVREMLRSGIIIEEDYAEIESIIAENTGLSSCTIYR